MVQNSTQKSKQGYSFTNDGLNRLTYRDDKSYSTAWVDMVNLKINYAWWTKEIHNWIQEFEFTKIGKQGNRKFYEHLLSSWRKVV